MPTQPNKPADVPFMPRGAVIRMVAASAFCAIALYLVVFWSPTVEIRDDVSATTIRAVLAALG